MPPTPIPGGGDRGGDPKPLPENNPEAENRDIALKISQSKIYIAV